MKIIKKLIATFNALIAWIAPLHINRLFNDLKNIWK